MSRRPQSYKRERSGAGIAHSRGQSTTSSNPITSGVSRRSQTTDTGPNSGRTIGIEEIGRREDLGIHVLSGRITTPAIVWSTSSDPTETTTAAKDGAIPEKNSRGVVIARLGLCVED